MRTSVTAPVEQALGHTKSILFDDFRFRMWLGLGFCAFLRDLFSGLTSNLSSMRDLPSPGGSFPASPNFDSAAIGDIVEAHPILILVVAAITFPFSVAILWLRSRGDFMFLDGVLNNSGAIREPWRTLRYLGNSIFRLKLLLLAIGTLLVAPFGAGLFYRFVHGDRLPFAAAQLDPFLIVLGVLVAIFAVVAFVILIVLHDFVVPTMYRRNLLVTDAWSVFAREIVPGHRLSLVLFYAMKLLLGIAIGILVAIGTCITCCIAALPYISSVVFLPFLVFMRLYSIYFLEQFGPDWWFFAREDEPTPGPGPSDDLEPDLQSPLPTP